MSDVRTLLRAAAALERARYTGAPRHGRLGPRVGLPASGRADASHRGPLAGRLGERGLPGGRRDPQGLVAHARRRSGRRHLRRHRRRGHPLGLRPGVRRRRRGAAGAAENARPSRSAALHGEVPRGATPWRAGDRLSQRQRRTWRWARVSPWARTGRAKRASWARGSVPALVDMCTRAFAEGATATSRRLAFDGTEIEVLVEPILPAPRLFVVGSGHDAVPVVDIARTVGWEAMVCEPHGRGGTRERFPAAERGPRRAARGDRSTHRGERSPGGGGHGASTTSATATLCACCSRRALGTSASLALAGGRRECSRSWPAATSSRDERVHAPVGLELGAESPQEIALAIIAEVQSVLARAAASSLRLRPGPIHADAWA